MSYFVRLCIVMQAREDGRPCTRPAIPPSPGPLSDHRRVGLVACCRVMGAASRPMCIAPHANSLERIKNTITDDYSLLLNLVFFPLFYTFGADW
jgi:hypothetical protein